MNVAGDLLNLVAGNMTHPAREYSPLALAYIGDAVYEIFIRTYVVNKGNRQVNKMHKASRDLVKASTQCKIYHIIEDSLTEEEMSVLKRGRNAKSFSSPKNGDITDYRHATGIEALVGYLYIDGQHERIQELINMGLNGLMKEQG